MELGDGAIWQVAAGDTDRSYQDLCLRWDVIQDEPTLWEERKFAFGERFRSFVETEVRGADEARS